MKAHAKQRVPFAIFSQIHGDRLGKEGKPLESKWKALFPSRNFEIFGNIPEGQTKISLPSSNREFRDCFLSGKHTKERNLLLSLFSLS